MTLQWDACNSPDVDGYIMYYGLYSGTYEYSIDVGNATTCTIRNLAPDETYFFAVTAYTSASESGFSNEACCTFASDLKAESCADESAAAGHSGSGGSSGGCFITLL